jgi:hypothetical protein
MTITLSIWSNIKNKQKATNVFKELLNGSDFAMIKTEIYWKDTTKRLLTFKTETNSGDDLKTKLFDALKLISPIWTLNIDGLNNVNIQIDGHATDNFKHTSITFATVISE